MSCSKFYTPEAWIERTIRILVIGAGGTGGEVLDALDYAHSALIRLGHPGGLAVTVMDADTVSAANIGRQRFNQLDIGHSKAVLLTHRHNIWRGLQWRALPRAWTPEDHNLLRQIDLLITCVDKASVRIEIARAGHHCRDALWMDFGNGANRGQCVLGHLGAICDAPLRLPHVFDLFPELSSVDDTAAPSCSLEEALRQQDLFVNRSLANTGMAILWNLWRHGETDTHGAYVEVNKCITSPIRVDPLVWASLGYQPKNDKQST